MNTPLQHNLRTRRLRYKLCWKVKARKVVEFIFGAKKLETLDFTEFWAISINVSNLPHHVNVEQPFSISIFGRQSSLVRILDFPEYLRRFGGFFDIFGLRLVEIFPPRVHIGNIQWNVVEYIPQIKIQRAFVHRLHFRPRLARNFNKRLLCITFALELLKVVSVESSWESSHFMSQTSFALKVQEKLLCWSQLLFFTASAACKLIHRFEAFLAKNSIKKEFALRKINSLQE